MKHLVAIVYILLMLPILSYADSLTVRLLDASQVITYRDEEKSIVKKYPPHFDSIQQRWILRNQDASFGKKVLRGSGLILAAQSMTTGLLFVLPRDFSNWKVGQGMYKHNFKEAFTRAPVFDKDAWFINYVGHPYQGSYYYNAYRSQGAKVWQAVLFSFAHSTFWEYMIESGFERPSIQDLIVTPGVGSLLGELFHFSTVKMSKNGFKWYEAAFVSLFNPMFAINNGFKRFNKEQKYPIIIEK